MHKRENRENVLEGHRDCQGGVPEYSHRLGTSALEDAGPTQGETESEPNSTFHQLFSCLLVGGWGGGAALNTGLLLDFSSFLPCLNREALSVFPGRGSLLTEQISASQVLLTGGAEVFWVGQ